MDDDDVIALIGLALVLHKRKRKRDRTEKRNHFSHVNLINELKFTPTDYKNYLRMDEKLYLKLLSLITPLIQRQDTVMREAISAHERLAVTLRFLATGRTECLKHSAVISPQALGQIIPETCDAIYKALKEDYLQFPDSTDKWKEIAQLFEERWNFPHCLGAIDGKHIDIVQPADSGCQYYNYKGRYSMVLMAIVDANYRFLLVDFGTNGRVCDAGVLQNTRFFGKLQMQHLNLPNSEPIQHSSRCLPYVFVADDALPLRPDMLKPYRQANLNSHEKKIFNYRLSRARRTVENAFGILASRFRIYHTQINLEPNNIQKLVMATCALHNFLIEHTPDSYAPPRCFYRENVDNGTVVSTDYDTAPSNVEDLQGENRRNVLNDAKQVRIEYQTYFVNEGKVPWQDSFIEM